MIAPVVKKEFEAFAEEWEAAAIKARAENSEMGEFALAEKYVGILFSTPIPTTTKYSVRSVAGHFGTDGTSAGCK